MRRGAAAGLRQGLWLLALMVPISLGVTVLRWVGALAIVASWVKPALRLLGLPGETGVALITAAAINLYSGIAVLVSIPLTARQITILGMMMLICHNLPVEVAVQRRAGSSGLKMLALRIGAAVAAGALLHLFLPMPPEAARTHRPTTLATLSFPAMLWDWARGAGWLVGKALVLVVALMILHRLLEEFGLARLLGRLLAPVIRLLGLSHRTAFLWIVANTLGLAYGAAVILEETRSGKVARRDVELLNRSVAVCHSLLEDTLLLVAIGAWAFWITVPRVALAAAVVWAYRGGRFVAGRRS